MVHQITQSKFKIFIETGIITLLILLIGFSIGFYIEYYHADKIIKEYKDFEINVLDLKLGNYYYQIMDSASCEIAIKENIIFADRLYEQGMIIQKYEDVDELTDSILLEKKKYVLLKTELWLNSILLKKKCDNPFNTVVYIYSQETNNAKEAEQKALSEILRQIKEEKGNSIILIPIAGDLGLPSVDMLLRVYNVTYLPSVIIDEKTVLEGFQNTNEIEKYLS